MDTQMVLTHTGKIYFNRSLGLEFLTVGDYGKENNIKADFLGLTKKIEGVQHHDVDLMDKWVATISSQKGCPMKCTFCDVHKYGFCLIWNIRSATSLNMRISVLLTVSMSITLAWASRLGILRCWILLSLDWTTWLKSVVFTLSPSIP
jgi:hypothetical protein